VFNEGTPYWDYFSSQLEWMKRLANPGSTASVFRRWYLVVAGA
jgi:hypothetical protein